MAEPTAGTSPWRKDGQREPAVLSADATLGEEDYRKPVEVVAQLLLGCLLVSLRAEGLTAGIIVESEAYDGPDDPASHAAFRRGGTVTAMWGPGGHAYVYRAYGVYPCFNAVVGPSGMAGAVLIRALEPLIGSAIMTERVSGQTGPRIAAGPGKLGLALGISLDDNGLPLDRPPLWIQPWTTPARIVSGPRVGITRARERRWRFGVAGHPSLSRPFPRGNSG